MKQHSRMRGSAVSSILAASLFVFVLDAGAQEKNTLWRIDGATNTVFVLGSVHALRPSDHPLPDAMLEAYENSDVIYMELDMDDLDPIGQLTLFWQKGLLPKGQTLKDAVGDDTYAQLEERAGALDIDLSLLDRSAPWLAAITVDQLMLFRLGFDPAYGVEMFFVTQAGRDAKEIVGLETVEYQIGVFADMSAETQAGFLLSAFTGASEYESTMQALVSAWRSGDSKALDDILSEAYAEYPEIYEDLIVTRNRNFADRIAQLLQQPLDYLVIVGAGHLVGKDSVIRMLGRDGVAAEQL